MLTKEEKARLVELKAMEKRGAVMTDEEKKELATLEEKADEEVK